MVTEITMQDMQQENSENDTVARVVMFYGPTCGPCKATMPNYEATAEFFETRGAKIKFFRINAWEPEEQAKYCTEIWGVSGVPTFKVFFKGQYIKEKVGGGDEPAIKQFMQDVVDDVYKQFQEKI